jgi:hypothetical protein
MTGRVFVKDPTTTVVTFGFITINGFAEGDAISVARDGDLETLAVGVDGDVARVKNAGRPAKVTIRLMEGSPANALMNRVRPLSTPLTPKGDHFAFTMTDYGSGETWFSAESWISSDPLPNLAAAAGAKEWVVQCAYLVRTDI